MNEYITVIQKKDCQNKYVSQISNGIIHYTSTFSSEFSFASEADACEKLMRICRMYPELAVALHELEIVTYTLSRFSQHEPDIFDEYECGMFTQEEFDSMLREILSDGVRSGFKNVPNVDMIFTSEVYFDIVKSVVPPLMITEYKDYIERGVLNCTAEELCAIMLVCTDEMVKKYDILKYFKQATAEENFMHLAAGVKFF